VCKEIRKGNNRLNAQNPKERGCEHLRKAELDVPLVAPDGFHG